MYELSYTRYSFLIEDNMFLSGKQRRSRCMLFHTTLRGDYTTTLDPFEGFWFEIMFSKEVVKISPIFS